MLPKVCDCPVKQLSHLPKNHWILFIHSSTKRYQQNASWPHFSWPTLYVYTLAHWSLELSFKVAEFILSCVDLNANKTLSLTLRFQRVRRDVLLRDAEQDGIAVEPIKLRLEECHGERTSKRGHTLTQRRTMSAASLDVAVVKLSSTRRYR